MTEKASFRVISADSSHIDQIVKITNEAFMADAFFKKPEYHLRFDKDTVNSMISARNSLFLLAALDGSGVDDEICGSIFFDWKSGILNDGSLKIVGKFSAVSVPEKFGKRGIGKALIKGVENKLIEIVKAEQETVERSTGTAPAVSVHVEMGVINLRTDLFPWYESQGYAIVEEIRPNDAEITRIILDDLDVCCLLMRKTLTV